MRLVPRTNWSANFVIRCLLRITSQGVEKRPPATLISHVKRKRYLKQRVVRRSRSTSFAACPYQEFHPLSSRRPKPLPKFESLRHVASRPSGRCISSWPMTVAKRSLMAFHAPRDDEPLRRTLQNDTTERRQQLWFVREPRSRFMPRDVGIDDGVRQLAERR